MKKIIYNIIKYPLILIFIKTPFINILKRRFKNQWSLKNKNIIWSVLDVIFQREYFCKLKDKHEMRELSNTVLEDGQGRKWAQNYYNKHFQKLDELKKRRTGTMSSYDALPIFKGIINYIKSNNLSDDKNTYIIQLGSSSGRDLEVFLRIFPKLNYISTDVSDEILDFQKEKYSYPNLKYFKCYGEDIDECINHFKISEKNIILFSSGSLQCVNPFFLEEFFSKIKNYKNINLFIRESISLSFMKKREMSAHRSNISFSHRYDEYAKKSGLKIIENKVIRPYLADDMKQRDTGHFYLQISN